jgi:acetyl-CoA carboxylase carboxyl transferase subunit beta
MLDRVTHRTKMRDELITIIRILLNKSPAIMGDLPKPSPEDKSTKKSKTT